MAKEDEKKNFSAFDYNNAFLDSLVNTSFSNPNESTGHNVNIDLSGLGANWEIDEDESSTTATSSKTEGDP